ncbi:MAG: thiamine/thiamine pyrophosphate ABC transporter permease [Rhizobiaceae bacterium]
MAAILLLALLCGGAFAGLAYEAVAGGSRSSAISNSRIFGVVRFTLFQAIFSTLLSVVPALLVARALSRHDRFFGRELLLRLFAVPQALPAIVAALGVLALYGRGGLLAEPLGHLVEGRWPGIYGLSGILIAHVFFNLPLAVRLFYEALQTIPHDHWRIAGQLGMGGFAQWRFIEWPVLRRAAPSIAGLVFMLCVTSFAIVLTLGGGPAATTLEVAIYQALRFDFDPFAAVVLTLLQLALTLAIIAGLALLGGRYAEFASLSIVSRRYVQPKAFEAIANILLVVLAALFVLAPMIAVVISGLKSELGRLVSESSVQRAALTSLVLAFLSACLAVSLSFGLVSTRKRLEMLRRNAGSATLAERLCDGGASMILVVPPIVIGAGWFVLARHAGDVFAIAPVMVVTVNAAMAMPFVVRTIRPSFDAAAERHDRLAASLGMTGWYRFRLVDWPAMRVSLLSGFAFAMALSLGDLGVIALFGSDSLQTMPYLLLSRMSSYRTADAAGLALILAALSFALMSLAGRARSGQ